ncbi:hypothetical protein AAUPMC_06462, partial [Pasteurella multocida subsp. multocida str. Anand1_cattle]
PLLFMTLQSKKFQPNSKGKRYYRSRVEKQQNDRKGILAQLAGHFVYFEQRMWRRKDYKLVFNATDVCELYDVRRDPEEMHNLFYDERYKDVKKEMLEEMRVEMKRLGDPLENWGLPNY